mmetsp:Transcript_24549/g.76003  ORF Transcript_24549/g.76003 Transcript_24549/m.76003 type:complete len:305 (-) Transcript_24549:97-1011(-)
MLKYLVSVIGPALLRQTRAEATTSAHLAAAAGSIKILQFLCDQPKFGPGFIKLRRKNGDTVAHQAAQRGDVALLRWIAENIGVELMNATRDDGTTIAQIVATKSIDAMDFIAKCPGLGPDFIKIADKNGNTAAHQAAENGKTAMLQYLNQTAGRAFLRTPRHDGFTIAHAAAAGAGNSGLQVLKLIAADPGMGAPFLRRQTNDDKTTIAHQAAIRGNVEVLRWIHATLGAEFLRQQRKRGLTISHLAAAGGWIPTLELIVELLSWQFVVAPDDDGDTPEVVAAQFEQQAVLVWFHNSKRRLHGA